MSKQRLTFLSGLGNHADINTTSVEMFEKASLQYDINVPS